MNEPHDELDDLLAPKAGEDAALRESLFALTERRVVWNRRVRFVPKAIVVPVIFILGGVCGYLAQPTPNNTQNDLLRVHVIHEVIPVVILIPVPQPADPSGLIAKAPEPMTASDAEIRAELADDPREAARFYRTAGDKYLNDVSDYANAARCYRLFLSRAGSGGLNPESGDTWLLTSLKNAAFKEKAHDAKTGG